MMKVIVVLYGPGGERNHKILTVIAHDPPAALSAQIHEVIRTWELAPGDTIKITQPWYSTLDSK
jgi:hypothetical protein